MAMAITTGITADIGCQKKEGLVGLAKEVAHNLRDLESLIKGTFEIIEKQSNAPETPVPLPSNPLDDVMNHLKSMTVTVNSIRDFFNKNVANKL